MYISLVLLAAHYHDYCVHCVTQIHLLLLHMMISDLTRSDCGLTMRTSISAQSGHGHEERVLLCCHSVDSCTVPVKCSFIMNTKGNIGVWMLLAECSESISHNHTTHIKKCPDSIVGKRQRPQAFLIYSYVISTAIGTWYSVLQSQHPFLQLTI